MIRRLLQGIVGFVLVVILLDLPQGRLNGPCSLAAFP